MPDSILHFAAVVASFFLRVLAAYGICWLLSRLSPSPRRRFLLWLAFLLGAAGYWLLAIVPAPVHFSVTAAVQSLPVHTAHTARNLIFPAAWAPALDFLGPILMAAYGLGVLLFLGRMLWQHFSLRRALRHAVQPSRDLSRLFGQMCRGFGIRRCDLLILPHLSSPAVAGWVRPRILLPEICEHFGDSSQLADVLYHELVHVARRDYLWAAVSDLVRCLLFFHPAVWRVRQHMRVQRELACDVAVISGRPEHRADYAQSLTRFARLRMLQPGRSMGIDFAASASILGMRVRAVLDQRPQGSWWRAGLRSLVSLGLVICFGLAWPMLGIAAEFAAAQPQPVPEAVATSPAVAQPHRSKRKLRVAVRQPTLAAPARVSQPEQTLLLPAITPPPDPPASVAMADNGPQSLSDDTPEQGPVADNGDPTWTETLPLPQSHTSVASVVQRVATGIAQIARAEVGRDGHDRGGRW